MKRFLSPPLNSSLESRARELLSDGRAGVVQRGEGDFASCAVAPSDIGRFSYVQLCLFCFRQFLAFEEASSPSEGTETRKGKQKKGSNDTWTPLFVERLAELAYRLGFDSSKIRATMQEENQTEGIARSIHLYILGKSCEVDEELFAEAIRRLRESIKDSKACIYDQEPELSTDSGSLSDENVPRQEISSERFYLPTLCKTGIKSPKRFMTPLAVQREAFLAFFGHDILTMYEASGGSSEVDAAAAAQAEFQSPPVVTSPRRTPENASNSLNTNLRATLATASPTESEEHPQNVSAYNRYESLIGGTLQPFSSSSSGEYYEPTWEYTDLRHASELMQALAAADDPRWNEGKITFWKLEDSCSIKVSRQPQALRDVLSRIATGNFENIRVPQLFGMVVEDQFRYYRPPHFPTLEATQTGQTFRNVVFLIDAFITEDLSLWQTMLDGGSFKERSMLALSSDLISRSSNKRKHTSSMYSDESVAPRRVAEQKRLRR
ncbi:hypothetical protein MPH_13458 [Macrophomina phaseolina MS6]|uniref:Uncharacterized protein n=1 Tax=Macrophomina phaseolina (strain MS6) TaxID=1126212 RepID=K2R5R0_MACPH|nr:hypothetical protein MPH_13458 [Macrophomina phaseolina MS6]